MPRKKFELHLIEAADAALNQMSQSIDDVSGVTAVLSSVCADNEFEHLEKDLTVVFQLDRLAKAGQLARGFPGIVFTGIAGRMLDPTYKPTKAFYDMNPRAVFEKHIAPILTSAKYGAPMGKSDPLNVAKNQHVIDEEWAKGKRPEAAAMAAVRLLQQVESFDADELQRFFNVVLAVYIALGKLHTRDYGEVTGGVELYETYETLRELIEEAPAGGSTPQAIVGACLQAQHDLFGSVGVLHGVGESVFATNTTSGKPGDFSEDFEGHFQVYEISVKRVDNQRVAESSEAVRRYLGSLEETPPRVGITFLSRPEDVQVEGIEGQMFNQDGLTYHFVDIWEWLLHLLERLGPFGREQAIGYVNSYVSQGSTSLHVKDTWSRIQDSRTTSAAED